MNNTLTLSFPLVPLTDEGNTKVQIIKKIVDYGMNCATEKIETPPDWDEFCHYYDLPLKNLRRIDENLDLLYELEASIKRYQDSKK